MRDADGTTLDTVNLASQGSQRYQTAWQVAADPSGQGRYISIVTSVYTDSGYTTKSENYGDEENTYLIFDRVLPAMRGGGGGGGGVDAYTVRRIVKEELGSIEKPEPVEFPEIPQPKEYEANFDQLLLALEVLRKDLAKVPTREADLNPLIEQINAVGRAIEQKPVTPETDLTPVLERLTDDRDDSEVRQEDLRTRFEELEEKILNAIPEEITKAIRGTNFVSQFHTFASPDQERKTTEKERPFDLSKLAK